MTTIKLINEIDSLWEILWTKVRTNPLDVIKQMEATDSTRTIGPTRLGVRPALNTE